ncbi:MAG: glycosyltransferase [Heliobacteriaceae bacterium]|nr:glycosyltransferase [Heliobacteriaceae bacterium]
MVFRNEAKYLGKCLKSLAGIVDEVVLIDTGSTDGSREIALSFGAQVIDDPWQNDFSYHRNKALILAKGQWILTMDGDEVWKGPGRKELEKLLSHQDIVAYQGLIHDFISEDGRQYNKSMRPRIWRNRPEIRYVRRIHEQLIGIPYNTSAVVFEPKLLIYHFGYTPSEMIRKNRAERNIRLLAEEAAGPDADPFTFFNLGTALASAGRFREAVPHLEKAKALVPQKLIWVPQIYKNLANCQLNLGWYREAFQVLWPGIQQFSFIPDYWYYLAHLYRQTGKLRDAARAYHRCATMDPPDEQYHWDPTLQQIAKRELSIVLEQIKIGSPPPPLLSLCMMVRDEAKHLERCLGSVIGVVNEIILIDTGSQDKTVEIAQSFNAKVFYEPWIDHFAKIRNASMDKATGQWILILDADDELSPEAKEQIPQLARKGIADGYALYTVNHIGPKENLSSLGHFSGRLFRNRPDLYYVGAIHEQIAGPIPPHIESRPYIIFHHGYLHDEEKDQKRNRRNMTILTWELDFHPRNSYFQYQAGLEAYKQKDYQQALHHFRNAYECMVPESAINPDIFQRLAFCYRLTQQKDEAWKWLEQGIKAYPDYVDIFLTAANWHYADSRYPEALHALGKCFALGHSRNAYPQVDGAGTYRAHQLAGCTHERLGNWEKALQHYYLSLNQNKAYGASILSLLQLARRCLTKTQFQLHLNTWFNWDNQETGLAVLVMLNRCGCFSEAIEAVKKLEPGLVNRLTANNVSESNLIYYWKAWALLGQGFTQEARVILKDLPVEEKTTGWLWEMPGTLAPNIEVFRLTENIAEGRFEPLSVNKHSASSRLLRIWNWICSKINTQITSPELDWSNEKESSQLVALVGMIAHAGYKTQTNAVIRELPNNPQILRNAFWYFTFSRLEPLADVVYHRLISVKPDCLGGHIPHWRLRKEPGKSLLGLLANLDSSNNADPYFFTLMAEIHLRLGLQVYRSTRFPRDKKHTGVPNYLKKALALIQQANQCWPEISVKPEHVVYREGWVLEQ